MTADLKRPAEEEHADAPEAKVSKLTPEQVKALEAINSEIIKLDTECRAEQIVIQCKYDKQKNKHFQVRADIFKKIPDFWKILIENFAVPRELAIEQDMEVLSYLTDIFLDDNMDKEGSHKFTFTFKENPFIKETEIVKEINAADPDNLKITTSPITWTKNILEGLEEEEKSKSFFTWLLSDTEEREDFGNTFREKVWEEALAVYENEADDAEYEGEDGDEEDDEEESDGEEDEDKAEAVAGAGGEKETD